MEPLFLTLDEVLEIHSQQIELYGGGWRSRSCGTGISGRHGHGEFRRAVPTPDHSIDGRSLPVSPLPEPSFVDGNKRTGANAAITFLLINDWELDFSEDELIDLVLSVASGSASKSTLTETFEARCRQATGPPTL